MLYKIKLFALSSSERAKISNSGSVSTEHHGSQVNGTAIQPGVMCMTATRYVIILRVNTLFPDVLGVDFRSYN